MNLTPSNMSLWDLRDELNDGAECRFDPELHTGPDLFTIEHPDARAAREEVAKQVCAECPVRTACLEYALRTRPEQGVWAGYTAEEINALAATCSLGEVA